jgi:8-oxo-dGTP diphosphatase
MKQQAITACAFIHKDGKLFVAKRAETKKFLPGKFELLGGHTEFGETLQESVLREVREELHIDIIVGEPFYAFTYLSDNGTVHNVEVDYFATMQDPDQEICLNAEDHSEFRWVTEEEADAMFPPDDAELKAIKQGFNILKKL